MSLIYLSVTTLKNNLKDLVHHPGRLVSFLLLGALLLVSLVSSLNAPSIDLARPREELLAIVLLFYAVTFVLSAMRGLDSGASFYSMADVHFLFSSPLPPRRVLFYGLIKQMGTSLLMGALLLFQYSWLHNLYGITLGDLAFLLLGFGLCLFCAQLTAMVLYSFTSGNDRARLLIKLAIAAVCAAEAAVVMMPVLQRPSQALELIVSGTNSLPLTLFPVAGWLRGAVAGPMMGDPMGGGFWLLICAVYSGALLYALSRARADFYEDVLQATEVSFSAITAKKEGRLPDAPKRRVRLGKTGLERGGGSGVFFYKHLLEDRRSGFLLLDGTSLLFVAMGWGFGWLMRDNGVLPILFFTTYLQIFSIATGRWVRELLLPYVYLLPEPPFRKLLNLSKENVLKMAVEAAALFIPLAFVMHLTPLEAAACFLMRLSFGILFMSGNFLIERVFGAMTSKTLVMLLYFLILLFLCLPGVAVGAVAAVLLGGMLPALALIALWNTGCAFLIAFLCRKMLDCAEMNNT